MTTNQSSINDRVQTIRDSAAGYRQSRLGRGNVAMQNGNSAMLSSAERRRRKEEQPEVVERLNKYLG